ncbi:hypothetical protein EJD97_006805, partial [Solanum chilense]
EILKNEHSKNAARRLEEEIVNAGSRPRGEQVPSLEEDPSMGQDPVNTPPFTDEGIRIDLIQLAQATTVQAQAMTYQANREVVPHPPQQLKDCPQVKRPSGPPINSTTWLKHVSNPRDQMSLFVTRVSEDLQDKCHSDMLRDNMNISHLMVHARRVKEARDKSKSGDANRARSFDGGATKNRL